LKVDKFIILNINYEMVIHLFINKLIILIGYGTYVTV